MTNYAAIFFLALFLVVIDVSGKNFLKPFVNFLLYLVYNLSSTCYNIRQICFTSQQYLNVFLTLIVQQKSVPLLLLQSVICMSVIVDVPVTIKSINTNILLAIPS